MSRNNEPKWKRAFTFEWSRAGEIAPPPATIEARTITEALLWFHLARQLKDGLSPEQYKVGSVVSNDSPPQTWRGDELPPTGPVRRCVLNAAMAKRYANEIAALQRAGQHFEFC